MGRSQIMIKQIKQIGYARTQRIRVLKVLLGLLLTAIYAPGFAQALDSGAERSNRIATSMAANVGPDAVLHTQEDDLGHDAHVVCGMVQAVKEIQQTQAQFNQGLCLLVAHLLVLCANGVVLILFVFHLHRLKGEARIARMFVDEANSHSRSCMRLAMEISGILKCTRASAKSPDQVEGIQ